VCVVGFLGFRVQGLGLEGLELLKRPIKETYIYGKRSRQETPNRDLQSMCVVVFFGCRVQGLGLAGLEFTV